MYGLSMTAMTLLIPLYAISQDFRLSEQGIIIAAPSKMAQNPLIRVI